MDTHGRTTRSPFVTRNTSYKAGTTIHLFLSRESLGRGIPKPTSAMVLTLAVTSPEMVSVLMTRRKSVCCVSCSKAGAFARLLTDTHWNSPACVSTQVCGGYVGSTNENRVCDFHSFERKSVCMRVHERLIDR